MIKIKDPQIILKVLEWAYERAISSVPMPSMDSAITLAQKYLSEPGNLENQVKYLIRWQNTKAAAVGFITGIAGVGALPLTIPGNLAGILFLQIRMVTTIAIMGGYDIHNKKVRTMIFACLCGSSTADILKKAGIQYGMKLTARLLQKKISNETLNRINHTVGLRLATLAGETGLVNLSKAVPLVGGIIGGSFDCFTTNMIGKIAKKLFIEDENFLNTKE